MRSEATIKWTFQLRPNTSLSSGEKTNRVRHRRFILRDRASTCTQPVYSSPAATELLTSAEFGPIHRRSFTGQFPNVVHHFCGLLSSEGRLAASRRRRKVNGGTLRSHLEADPHYRRKVLQRKEHQFFIFPGNLFTRIKHRSKFIGCLDGSNSIGDKLQQFDGLLHSLFVGRFPKTQYCLFNCRNHLLTRLFVQSIPRQNPTPYFGTSQPIPSCLIWHCLRQNPIGRSDAKTPQ